MKALLKSIIENNANLYDKKDTKQNVFKIVCELNNVNV